MSFLSIWPLQLLVLIEACLAFPQFFGPWSCKDSKKWLHKRQGRGGFPGGGFCQTQPANPPEPTEPPSTQTKTTTVTASPSLGSSSTIQTSSPTARPTSSENSQSSVDSSLLSSGTDNTASSSGTDSTLLPPGQTSQTSNITLPFTEPTSIQNSQSPTGSAHLSSGTVGTALSSNQPAQTSGGSISISATHSSLSRNSIIGIAIGSVIGAVLLALLACLFLLRHRRKSKKAKPQIEPFRLNNEAGRGISAIALSKEKPESGDELADPHRNTIGGASGEAPRVRSDSRPELGTGNEFSDADILRLFEDRTLEPHLLRLISQRMDSPPNLSSGRNGPTADLGEDGLPAYGSFT